MAITYKLFLDGRTKKGDKYPLKLRITYNRKHKVVPLNVLLKKDEWNTKAQKVKASHPNAKLITIKVNQLLNDVQENALKFEKVEKVYTVENLFGNGGNTSNKQVTFRLFATQEIDSLLKAGRVGNSEAYKTATNKLLRFAGKEDLRFEQIDFKFLDSFTNSMLAEEMTVNAIASYMREIRALYNKAINADLVEAKYYPFRKYKIRTTKTISRALSAEQMKQIKSLHIREGTPQWHSRNFFMLSFYLIGINFTDMFKLTKDSLHNNRVTYSRSKTKKIYSILVPQEANVILRHYEIEQQQYLLPILHKGDSPLTIDKKCHQAIKTTNHHLDKIAKALEIEQEVTTYYARYTWANIAKAMGYSKDLIAEALGHEYGNTVTGIYLDNYGNEVIDEANARIIKHLN